MGGKEQSMISCGILEKPGRWRSMVMASIFLLAFSPAFPLLWTILVEKSADGLFGSGFGTAVFHSLIVAVAVAATSVLLGVPAGLLSALYEFPGRRVLLALIAIPLLVPSFLGAIGFSQLQIYLGLPPDSFLSGPTGTILVFTAAAVPLVLYMTLVSARRLSKSQIEAVRLVGGEVLLFRYTAQAVLPAALLTGMLAGILTLSDPGPGQILGFSGVPYEILLSFSALYDFPLAAKQCAFLTGIVLLISTPIAILIAPNVAAGLLGRDIEPAPLARHRRAGWISLLLLCVIILITTVLPMAGIIRPLTVQFPLERALQEVSRTITNMFIYAFTAGFIATILGFLLAIAAGRESQLRRAVLIGLFLLLSLPPSINALGIIKLGTIIPAWLDPLLRSRFTVGLASALRFVPIATILVMRSFGTTTPSQALVASVHGVSLTLYIRRVLGPVLLPAIVLACLIVALLSTAEVGTALLLRPPGADSLPVQIFTVMANAPESLVAALCFLYIAGAASLLIIGWAIADRRTAA
ncbi:MAG: hypothetical protein M0Q44_00810 [Methylobacter sp.]|nr:hypothetical protein [Methylobacter sp.]